jgi:hypothetical protein
MSAIATSISKGRTIQAHYAEVTVERDGMLRLGGLPFSAGAVVEVIVLERPNKAQTREDELRGSVLKDDVPFDPAVPPEDWEAAR